MIQKLYQVARETLSNPWALLILAISMLANTIIVYIAMPSWLNTTWEAFYTESGSGFASATIFWGSLSIAFMITFFVTLLEVMVIGLAFGFVGAHFSYSRFIKPITTIAMVAGIFFIHKWWVEIITASVLTIVNTQGYTANIGVFNRLLAIFTLGQAIACLFVGVPLDLLYNSIAARFVVKTAEQKEDNAIQLLKAENRFQLMAVTNGQVPRPMLENLSELLGIGREVQLLAPNRSQLADLTNRYPGLGPVAQDLRYLPATNGHPARWAIDTDPAGYGRNSGTYVGLTPGENVAITPEAVPFRTAPRLQPPLGSQDYASGRLVKCPTKGCGGSVYISKGQVTQWTCRTCNKTHNVS